MIDDAAFIHPTADVADSAEIGPRTKIWNLSKVRERARIGADCNLGKNVFVDIEVVIGDRVKIQNDANLFRGVTVEDAVFIGPRVTFTNDRFPRATNPDGSPQTDADWELLTTLVRRGASIGAGAVVLPDLTIGPWAMVGAGSVVTRDVAAHELVLGNPARRRGSVCRCGQAVADAEDGTPFSGPCPRCGLHIPLPDRP